MQQQLIKMRQLILAHKIEPDLCKINGTTIEISEKIVENLSEEQIQEFTDIGCILKDGKIYFYIDKHSFLETHYTTEESPTREITLAFYLIADLYPTDKIFITSDKLVIQNVFPDSKKGEIEPMLINTLGFVYEDKAYVFKFDFTNVAHKRAYDFCEKFCAAFKLAFKKKQ